MQITTTNRHEFEVRTFMSGRVSPQLDKSNGNRDAPVERAAIAKGLVVDGTWYELPDNPDGEYVLIELLRTNQFGYYENGGSERDLIVREQAASIDANMQRGIVNQIAVIRVSGDLVETIEGEKELIRKQGA